MELAIVGLPGSGKSLLYQLLAGKESVSPAKRGGELHVATVELPDEGLARLGKLLSPERLTPAKITFVDWQREMGMQEGIPAIEDLLKVLRNADGFVLVLRAFTAPEGDPDPWKDWQRVQEELLLRDLQIVEARLDKVKRLVQVEKTEEHVREFELLTRCFDRLQSEQSLSDMTAAAPEERLLRGFQFLSRKPQVTLINVDDEVLEQGRFPVPEPLESRVLFPVRLSVKTELEISTMSDEEQQLFLPLLGEGGSALPVFLEQVQLAVDLIRFYTVKGPEVRAWLLPRGGTAQQAAGLIHTDMERGFIRAEVIPWQDLLEAGGMSAARESGTLRQEGKTYAVLDGDVLQIKFQP